MEPERVRMMLNVVYKNKTESPLLFFPLHYVLDLKKKKDQTNHICGFSKLDGLAGDQTNSEKGGNICSPPPKPFMELLLSALTESSDDSINAELINNCLPSCITPCSLCLFSSPVGAVFLVQTFRVTKHRFLPAGNAKRLHAPASF